MRLVIALLWLLHWLPYRWQARIGDLLSTVLLWVVQPRQKIVLRNLELCFPDWTQAQRQAVCRQHLHDWLRTFLDRGLLWFGSRERLEKLIRVEGLEHFQAALPEVTGQALMILMPHFVGLDAGGIAVVLRHRAASLYVQPPNAALDRQLRRGRVRFEGGELYTRSQGIRPIIKALRSGLPYVVLPDMDLGAQDAVFVDFFGVPTATVTVLPRLARLTEAQVLPLVVTLNDDHSGYTARFYPPWKHYPGELSDAQGTRQMNAFIEERVREMPAQYYWVHRRFKTRPAGEPSVY